jgi:2-dehydro-3-deoxy-D-arabinonate dehydratase
MNPFFGQTGIPAINRTCESMVTCLSCKFEFPVRAYLMTGTGIVPAGEFTLEPSDLIEIEITAVGKLVQTVVRG